ncbi:MAG TPA: outer membrane beta-barrel protein [Ohtaekwangia sp.]|uniref:outer membrane beta-barrel protein n=1 Tax=Ohtaekwangia sp. TaxID=2066019 RepID=UPI002F95C4E7
MRTRIFILCIIAITMVTVATAQDKPHYIAITAGGSAPVGAFSKSDAGTFNHWNNKAGFAKTGFTIGVEGAYYILPKFGIAGTLYFADHGALSKSDAATLGDSYTDAFAVDESTVSTSKRYRSLNVMAGPQFSLPLNKLTIDVRVMAGVVKSFSTPEVTVQLEDQSTFKQASSTGSAFGWQAGAGFRYALSDHLGFLFRADYFKSNGIKVDNENRTNSAGRLVTKQPLSWVNGVVGISFTL